MTPGQTLIDNDLLDKIQEVLTNVLDSEECECDAGDEGGCLACLAGDVAERLAIARRGD